MLVCFIVQLTALSEGQSTAPPMFPASCPSKGVQATTSTSNQAVPFRLPTQVLTTASFDWHKCIDTSAAFFILLPVKYVRQAQPSSVAHSWAQHSTIQHSTAGLLQPEIVHCCQITICCKGQSAFCHLVQPELLLVQNPCCMLSAKFQHSTMGNQLLGSLFIASMSFWTLKQSASTTQRSC